MLLMVLLSVICMKNKPKNKDRISLIPSNKDYNNNIKEINHTSKTKN